MKLPPVRQILILVLTLGALSTVGLVHPLVAAQPDAELCFTILHTNDLHSHELAFHDQGKLIGGMPEIAELMHRLRAGHPDTVTVDAGDIFEGTPFFTYYHGDVEVKVLNDAAYDIYTIGNHEFDDGPYNLAKQLKQAKFGIINCNMDTSAYPALKALIKPSIVKTINGEKIAFIGAICPDLKEVTYRAEGVKVINADRDWISPIRDEVLCIKRQGINKIILVTHVGVDRDKLLAQLPDVDVIIGGHSHTRLEHPIVVAHADGSSCIIVQTGCYGRALGKLDLCFTADGRVDLSKLHYKLIDISSNLPSDSKLAEYLRKKAQPFEALKHEILARATDRFDNTWQSYPMDSPLGDLVTDALAEGAAANGATIALENRGGMRRGIDKGPISAEVVEELLPFNNDLVVGTITGDDLRKIIETSVGGSAVKNINLGAQFLDVHGLKFKWDPGRARNERVSGIWAANSDGVFVPVTPSGQYRVAINDYAFNIEGFDFSRAKNVVNTGKRLSVFLHDYLLKHGTVSPAKPGRIVPLSTLK